MCLPPRLAAARRQNIAAHNIHCKRCGLFCGRAVPGRGVGDGSKSFISAGNMLVLLLL